MTMTITIQTTLTEGYEPEAAAKILAAPLGSVIKFTLEDISWELIVNNRSFGHVPEEVDSLEYAKDPANCEAVTLSSDGRGVATSEWHTGDWGDDEDILWETWGRDGRKSHGFCHSVSRRVVQYG